MKKFISFKILFAIFLLLPLFTKCNKNEGSQLKVKVLQPGPEDGKDSNIWSLYPDRNGGDSTFLRADVGLIENNSYIERSLLQFDLSSIPEGSEVLLAELALYYYDPENRDHHTTTGPNTAFIQRIIASWTESSITWNNQPSSTTQDQSIILDMTESRGDLIDQDITTLVQEMVNNRAEDYGFIIKLETEDGNKGMYFASSDHPDPNLHPKLIVTYYQ